MRLQAKLRRQIVALEKLSSWQVDCVLESKNNVQRHEWKFAKTNLRMLFRNADAISKQRNATFRLLRQATKESA